MGVTEQQPSVDEIGASHASSCRHSRTCSRMPAGGGRADAGRALKLRKLRVAAALPPQLPALRHALPPEIASFTRLDVRPIEAGFLVAHADEYGERAKLRMTKRATVSAIRVSEKCDDRVTLKRERQR